MLYVTDCSGESSITYMKVEQQANKKYSNNCEFVQDKQRIWHSIVCISTNTSNKQSTLTHLLSRLRVFYSVEMLFASSPQESTLVLNTTQND